MASDLLKRKQTHFVLWRPRVIDPPPTLVIGKLQPGNPPTFVEDGRFELRQSAVSTDFWEIPAAECDLTEGEVYHYWFSVTDSNPYKAEHPQISCTDPTAWAVDWRLLAPRPSEAFVEDDRDPASVVKLEGGRLVAADPGGETPDWIGDTGPDDLAPNNRLVIYELPTAWSRLEELESHVELDVGTFRDILALLDSDSPPGNFTGIRALGKGRAHLLDLGANALELLPPADSFVDREWGYATSNYFAADYDLGFPRRHFSPTATTDLARVIKACHQKHIRFFTDMVMAFATRYSYQNINFLDFHVQAYSGDPEEFDGSVKRDAFGGDLFKYNFWVNGYDPVSGTVHNLVPARQLLLAHLVRWMLDFRIDGIRMDSITSFGNWDFVREFKDHARALWRGRWDGGLDPGDIEARFLVVGEDLSVPLELITQNRLDGLWNEEFKRMVRHAILGEKDDKAPDFESTVRRLIDCRQLGFTDGVQAINYVTSHDVEGFRNERLYNLLNNNGVIDTEPRIKLAFACLLTAVGVPMIFAGEEFADEHDLAVGHPSKQIDPVNFDRLEDDWRQRIFQYVCRLVHLRTTCDALAVNDTRFIHVDMNGKQVLAWVRGQDASGNLVVVVANFSDFGTPDSNRPEAEYIVNNWPATPPGMQWREITQERNVPPEWVGREPIFPWEAKVYALLERL